MNIEELTQKTLRVQELFKEHNEKEFKKRETAEMIVMQLVSDVGDLSRHILKKERGDGEENFKEGTARELAECLGHILVLAKHYDINLEESFLEEFDHLESKLSQN